MKLFKHLDNAILSAKRQGFIYVCGYNDGLKILYYPTNQPETLVYWQTEKLTKANIQELYQQFCDRCWAIDQSARRRTNARLIALHPGLPDNDTTIHLAHNWLVCQGNLEAWEIMKDYHKLQARLGFVQSRYWKRLHERFVNQYIK